MARKEAETGYRVVAKNRKARHNYLIEDHLEAGIILTGSEVKSLRLGRASIGEAYGLEKDGKLLLINVHIPHYDPAGRYNHEPRRSRQLLLHRRQIDKLMGAVARDGMTLVPLSLYFNERGIAKVDLGIARGKKKHDKRAAAKEKDWKRDQGRLLRDKG
jgi:SsrA-binding protein